MISRLLGWLAPYAWGAAGVVVAALVLALGAQSLRLALVQRDLAELQAARQVERTQRADAARIAEADARSEEQRRAAAEEEAHAEAQRYAARARADADLRRSADDRLQHAVTAIAASCGATAGDRAAAAVSPAASTPGDLLAHVQRRMGEAAGGVVEYADGLRAAGGECVARYDALIPP